MPTWFRRFILVSFLITLMWTTSEPAAAVTIPLVCDEVEDRCCPIRRFPYVSIDVGDVLDCREEIPMIRGS